MTDPLILHYAPDNASLCVRLALTELGLPFETRLVNRATQAQKSPAYLALNPNGLIPTLETADGAIYETAAILLWLADKKQGTAFPACDDPARGAALSRLFWLSNTLHPCLRMLFYPQLFGGNDRFQASTRATLHSLFVQMDTSDLTWVDREGPAILGCYLAPMIRWCGLYGGDTSWFDLNNYPRLRRFAARCETAAPMQSAIISEGLGNKPLTQPAAPTPPEGTAT